MELVSTILALALKIAKAVETARENKAMCLDLADRARTICNILREDRDSGASMTAGGGDSKARRITRPALERLKAALDDALKLVESHRLSGGIERAVAFFTADAAPKFQLLQTRISDCVNDLKYAKLVAADHRAHDGNTRTAPLKPLLLKPSPLLQPSPLKPSLLKPLPLLQPSSLKPSPLKPPQPAERGEGVESLLKYTTTLSPQPAERGVVAESLLKYATTPPLLKPPQRAERGEVVESLLKYRTPPSLQPAEWGEVAESLLKHTTTQPLKPSPQPAERGEGVESLLKYTTTTPPQPSPQPAERDKVVESLLKYTTTPP
ncbi:uncharacterized protein LOC123410792 [Hordeum vulgare subsp. vulgare]|uniref:uncharacterized protein LOC123410792 n=1 Tax=Hordeum vulgare subsp. vulgare TaxID=112509 RepID=UPI001B852353|nr:uncharacterized protein LOC123410792 [Hordeum vulgare subsp. vulgare]